MNTIKQPEALRLAEVIDRLGLGDDIAVELRRLHDVNMELIDTLGKVLSCCKEYQVNWMCVPDANRVLERAQGNTMTDSELLDKFEECAYQLGISHGKKLCGVYNGTDAIMDNSYVKSIEECRKNLRALLKGGSN